MEKKDIVFYSNYCTYCKEVITRISKLPIKDKLIYICVDDSKIQLPNFVKAVPTIYLANKKQIVIDESIEKWIESLHQKPKENIISDNELQAYYGNGDVNVFSTSFSSIGDEVESDMPFSSGFSFLDEKGSINTPKETSSGNSKQSHKSTNSSLSKSYEQLINSRKTDMSGNGIIRS